MQKFSAHKFLVEDNFEEEDSSSSINTEKNDLGGDNIIAPEKQIEPDSLDEEVIIQHQIDHKAISENSDEESSFDEKYLAKKL